MAMRFHLDENVTHALADALGRRGVDVTTTAGVGLIHASDEEHLAFCRENQRVIVTHDDDFLRLHRNGVPHAGIAFFPPEGCPTRRAIQGCILIWEALDPADMANHVEYL